MIEPLLEPFFHLERRNYWSILPTATPYARNALFAGLYPLDIAEGYPHWWIGAADHEGSRNAHEGELLDELLRAHWAARPPAAAATTRCPTPATPTTCTATWAPWATRGWWPGSTTSWTSWPTAAARTASSRNWRPDEAAFRTLMRSWFEHSNLFDVLKNLARRDCTVILTTDHGSMLCQRAAADPGQPRHQQQRALQVRRQPGRGRGEGPAHEEPRGLPAAGPEHHRELRDHDGELLPGLSRPTSTSTSGCTGTASSTAASASRR